MAPGFPLSPAARDSTPLLDRTAPLPPPVAPGSGVRIFVGVGFGLAAALAGIAFLWRPPLFEELRAWILAQFEDGSAGGATALHVIAVAAPALAAAVSVLVIHELGHALGGLLAGFRFRSLAIGPLRVDEGFRISLHRGALSWSGGWVGMVPARADNLRWRALALVGAGPLANLLSGCAVLLWPAPKGFASGVFIAASFIAVAFDLPPFRRRELALDGWRILALLRDSAWGRRWLALLRLGAELERGVMPEAWSPESLARAVALEDDSPDTVTAHAFAFSSAYHRRADDEAARALETCLRHSHLAAPALREALMSDAVVFQARRRKRPDLAEQWLAAMPEALQVPWSRARAEAGVREARGDIDGALGKLAEVERGMQALPDARQRATALRFLERWRSELQAQLRAPAAT